MKILRNILLMLLVCGSACTDDRTEEESLIAGGGQIVLEFTSGALSRATADTEKAVKHLDLFVFTEAGAKYLYRRFPATGTSLTLSKNEFTDVRYKAYIVANSTLTTDVLEKIDDLSALQTTIQVNELIHQTGGGSNTPTHFLMDGVVKTGNGATTFVLNDKQTDSNIELKAALARAAAKISVTFKAQEGGNVRFITSSTSDPEGNPLEDGDTPSTTIAGYLNNMRIDTKVIAGNLPVTEQLISPGTPINTSAATAFGTRPLVTYVYSHSWADGGDALSRETYLVVQLPIWYRGTDDEWQLQNENYYKVPVYTKEGGQKYNRIDRNTHYDITVEVNQPGASEYTQAKPLEGTYAVEAWDIEQIEVGDGGEKPVYLEVNKEELFIRNVEDDYSIEFASSSPVEAKITRVYYKDKNGNEREIPEREWDTEQYQISVEPDGEMNGKLNLHSEVPTNNLIRYIELEITNEDIENSGDNEDKKKTVIVEQYPLEYITNIRAWYSYRTDFHGNDANDITTYQNRGDRYTGISLQRQASTWGNLSREGGNYFRSKYADWEQDRSGNYSCKIYNYIWRSTGREPVSNGTVSTSTAPNARIYHVQLTSSSKDYTLGVPEVDDQGITVPGEDNAKLVSPSFMIASQLGAVNSHPSHRDPEVNRRLCAEHCARYVEVYEDDNEGVVHLTNWRIPTDAELNIINRFQRASPDAIDAVLGQRRYQGSHSVIEVNPQNSQDVTRVRCVRDHYPEKEVK